MVNSQLEVTVIIPTYNRANFLLRAIDSVLEQKKISFELIVIDDGSTDSTKDLLASYIADKRIHYYYQSNKGVSAARNMGIKLAKAPYIAFLDSDDQWLSGKLETQINFFKSNPELQINQTQELWYRNNQRVNPKKKHLKKNGYIYLDSLKMCLISPSAVMIKKDLFNEIGLFDESLKAAEDYDLWLRITAYKPVGLIDKPYLIRYAGHCDQLSAIGGLDIYRIMSLKKMLLQNNLSEDYRLATQQELERRINIYSTGHLKRYNKKIEI